MIFVCLMMRRPPRSTQSRSSAASDVYKRQDAGSSEGDHTRMCVLRVWARARVPPVFVGFLGRASQGAACRMLPIGCCSCTCFLPGRKLPARTRRYRSVSGCRMLPPDHAANTRLRLLFCGENWRALPRDSCAETPRLFVTIRAPARCPRPAMQQLQLHPVPRAEPCRSRSAARRARPLPDLRGPS